MKELEQKLDKNYKTKILDVDIYVKDTIVLYTAPMMNFYVPLYNPSPLPPLIPPAMPMIRELPPLRGLPFIPMKLPDYRRNDLLDWKYRSY